MEPNLPATQTDAPLAELEETTAPLPYRQRLSVALLPLALVVFILLAFVVAAWSFLAAGG